MTTPKLLKILNAKKQSSTFAVEPEKLALVTCKESPWYDPRVELPVNEELVRSVMSDRIGNIEPIIVAIDGDSLVVVAGRQRVKALIEANRRYSAAGKEPLVAICRLFQRDSRTLGLVSLAENEIRRGNTAAERAVLIRSYRERGYTLDEIGTHMGLSAASVCQLEKLASAELPILDAVREGAMSQTEAIAASGLPREGQREIASEKIRQEQIRKKTGGKKKRAKKTRPGRHMREKISDPSTPEIARAALLWACGEAEWPFPAVEQG